MRAGQKQIHLWHVIGQEHCLVIKKGKQRPSQQHCHSEHRVSAFNLSLAVKGSWEFVSFQGCFCRLLRGAGAVWPVSLHSVMKIHYSEVWATEEEEEKNQNKSVFWIHQAIRTHLGLAWFACWELSVAPSEWASAGCAVLCEQKNQTETPVWSYSLS